MRLRIDDRSSVLLWDPYRTTLASQKRLRLASFQFSGQIEPERPVYRTESETYDYRPSSTTRPSITSFCSSLSLSSAVTRNPSILF
jgi:hypothetical protein